MIIQEKHAKIELNDEIRRKQGKRKFEKRKPDKRKFESHFLGLGYKKYFQGKHLPPKGRK